MEISKDISSQNRPRQTLTYELPFPLPCDMRSILKKYKVGMVLVVYFRIFVCIIICFAVDICDLVHDVEAILRFLDW